MTYQAQFLGGEGGGLDCKADSVLASVEEGLNWHGLLGIRLLVLHRGAVTEVGV